ncbi:TonB-dependent receptor plug domain-containing protein [Chitinophaga caseinilytica]|uniref:TonB-dependent receptor plug domain-containing protein n=1 Tax=Chitinophaga caseinilytica TaxID=2267521 RepID=A0ABZ2YWU8_9BACT
MNVYSLPARVVPGINQKSTRRTGAILAWLLCCILSGSAAMAQKITLNEKNASLKKIFQQIQKQSDYVFLYEKGLLDNTLPVTIQVRDEPIDLVLSFCFLNQPLSYIVSGKNIGVRRIASPATTRELKVPDSPSGEELVINGIVMDSLGFAKPGVTVVLVPRGNRPKTITFTDANGVFELSGQKGDRLEFTAVGHKNEEVRFNGETHPFRITMRVMPIEMNVVVVDDVNLSKKRIPFTDTIDMTHRTHLNLGQLLQGTIPGLTLQNSSQSVQTLYSIDFDGAVVAGSGTPTVEAMRDSYNQYKSYYVAAGYPTFESWINSFKGKFKFNYRTSVNNNGLVPQLRGVSGFNGDMSGMLVVLDGFPQEGFPATLSMANIQSVEIIKNPEELAKWGARAAGGIIMITSKRGTAGKLELSYASNYYYSPAPKLNRQKMRLASSADIIDYMRSASDSGFLVLGRKDYPMTAFNLNAAERLLQQWQQGTISDEDYRRGADSLSRLSNESQLGLLQQDEFNQNQTLTLAGGAGGWRFRAAGGYNSGRSMALRDRSRVLSLNVFNDFILLRNKLRAQWYVNTSEGRSRGGVNADFRSLQPYQMLLDPEGNYVYDYSSFHPGANAAIKKYGYEDFGVNLLEDARINSTESRNLALQSRLNTDWDLLPYLKWSNSFQFDLNGSRTEDLKAAGSSAVRALVNEYGSPVFDNFNNVTGVDFYVPRGGIMRKSEQKGHAWNLRSALQFNKTFGKHAVMAAIGGGGAADARRRPSYETIYGYDPQTGRGIPVRLPDPDPTAGIINLYSLPGSYWQDTYGRMVYPSTLLVPNAGDTTQTRGLNWNAALSYAFDSTFLLNGRYNSTLGQNYGHATPYTVMASYNGEAGWRLRRMGFLRLPKLVSDLVVSAGATGFELPGLPPQIQAARVLQSSWNNYGIWVSGFNLPQQNGQKSLNIYEKLRIGLHENRILLDVAYNTLRTEYLDGEKVVRQTRNYVGANGRFKMREGLLLLIAGYGYSLDGQPQTNLRIAYDIARETYFHARSVSKLSADFILQNISSYQGMELMTETNAPLADGGFSMAVNTNFGLLPPKVRNLEAHATLGMFNDRLMLDLRYYQKNTAGLNNNVPIPTDPATGLASKVTYSELVNRGVEAFLKIRAVESEGFHYTITFNGAYNRNVVRSAPPVYFSSTPGFLSAYRNGYPTDNIWSYRWAGLDGTGSPTIYDAKGQQTATPDSATLAAALVYSGVARPPYSGGFIQEWDYKGFFARATLLLNFGHVIREYIPVPSREADNSALIRDRWRKPGDEAFTDVPAMSATADGGSVRRLLAQYATNSIMPGDNVRLQEVQLGWQGSPGRLFRNYRIKDLMVSLQVMNLAVWSRNKLSVDPETVANTGQIGLPRPRQYSMSVNMKF